MTPACRTTCSAPCCCPAREVEALIKDDTFAAVTLTGSVAAGRAVATAAGSVLKKCVLELGGSDAYVVLEDADIDAAAKVAATARMVNGGQSCIAGKRFVVVRAILEAFEQALVEAMRGFEMGDPAAGGHQARPDAERQGARRDPPARSTRSIAKGARLLLGGNSPRPAGRLVSGDGARPTSARASRRMTRKCSARSRRSSPPTTRPTPSASPTPASSGSARACSPPTSTAAGGSRRRSSKPGMSFVNENVRSDPRTPFGGVKHSGYGRECGAFGIREFTNIKTVHVKPLGAAKHERVE